MRRRRSGTLAERRARVHQKGPRVIHIAWPWMLLALPLPWLLARWRPAAAPRSVALYFPFAAQVAASAAPSAQRTPRWRLWWFVVVWCLLVTAAARPQWLGAPQPVADTGRRLLLAVDTSGSMAARDMEGRASRLQVVKQVAGQFIQRRHGDQVGLILFGTRPYLQTPLSTDLPTVNQFLQEATIGMAGPATALGDAVGLALKQLRAQRSAIANRSTGNAVTDHRPAEPDRRTAAALAPDIGRTVLVLLTDGRSTAGEMPPLTAARWAAAAGLRIYTIGVGGGGDEDSDLDEPTLRAMATATGGAYFAATDAAALQAAYAQMDELEPAAAPDQWVQPSDEWFAWPLALALLLSVPAVALRGRQWS
jgi:Ca-activated chloride channel homolog